MRATWGRPAREMRFAASGLGLMRYDVPGGATLVVVQGQLGGAHARLGLEAREALAGMG